MFRIAVVLLSGALAFAQGDPGPRGGSPSAGNPVNGLSASQQQAFLNGQERFVEVDALSNGLGPRFNSNSCASCHAFPAVGGSSPNSNPQVQFANSANRLPSFITPDGPVREVRVIRNPDGSPDGGVHALFTVGGRPDTPAGCQIQQENFANANNLSFRIPTPAFGLGLIEAISDLTLENSLTSTAQLRASLGIGGHLNHSSNDGTVTRFGWKGQNKSLQIFAGEAYNVEQGITNQLFPNERDYTPNCSIYASTNDLINTDAAGLAAFDDVSMLARFMALLAPPERGHAGASETKGEQIFTNIGCAGCHTPTFTTDANQIAALSNQTIHPYSDFALHHMGTGLADGISQGQAGPDEFRSAPLWGLGQRLFFLHDGRTADLTQAIAAHQSSGSEANQVIQKFNALNNGDKQHLLQFLRSL